MTAITRLTLTDFRSHAHATITAGPGLVVITGDNGAGKTNILDAISLLAPGRGLRGAPLSDAARQDGPGGWSVAAHLISAEGEVQIGTRSTRTPAGAGERCRGDGDGAQRLAGFGVAHPGDGPLVQRKQRQPAALP